MSLKRSPLQLFITSALSCAALCLSVDTALSAPTISSIAGSATEQQSITITGANFGSGPNVILYDDLEGGSIGNSVDLAAPHGSWTGTVGSAPRYDSNARSGKSSMLIYFNGRQAILRKEFTPTTEVFYSFWVRVPPNTPFPGNGSGVNKFSTDSSWKFTWLMDTSSDGSSSDLCLPTHTGRGNFALQGNDMTLTWIQNEDSWWSWNEWMRMTVWLRADPSNPTDAGKYFWQVVSADKGQYVMKDEVPVFDSDGPSQKVFRALNMPGWIRWDGADAKPVYDDIYVATGANAQARVEVGDQPTYAASRRISLAVPESWSSSSIKAKLPAGSVPTGKTSYLYVTDKDGNVNSAGYPLVAGVAPNAPANVRVQ